MIVSLIESDAYHLIWASFPELFPNEDGTAKRSRRFRWESRLHRVILCGRSWKEYICSDEAPGDIKKANY